MIQTQLRYATLILFGLLAWMTNADGQQPFPSNVRAETAASRMRPIGSASAVDRYRRNPPPSQLQETAYQQVAGRTAVGNSTASNVQLAQFEIPNDAGPITPPAPVAAPALPPGNLPNDPRALPGNPNLSGQPINSPPIGTIPRSVPSSSDLTPMPPPQLSNGFATIDNCNCVSAASTYSAACGGCAPVSYQAPGGYIAPPAQISAPAVLPGNFPGQPAAVGGAGVPSSALISFGQEANPVVVGQGLLGQPVAYVPGQTFRNWIRYFFP
ncbi:MAG: hypothetical protein AB8B91_10215 [Rubripirellula sp.]